MGHHRVSGRHRRSGWISGICYEEKGRGIIAKQGQKVRSIRMAKSNRRTVRHGRRSPEEIKANGEWNHYEVIVEGNHAIHKINGQVTSEITDEQVEKAATKGLIAFQLHAGPPMKVEFKNIRAQAP